MDNYPFGKSEQFLNTELQFITQSFEKVTLFPIETGKDINIRKIPDTIEIIKPSFTQIKNKKELLNKGLFNKSLILPFFKEGIKSQVWKSWIKFRIWFTHLLLIRSMISEIRRRELISFFNQFDILYFYWGLRWSQVLPFLPPDLKPRIVVRFHGSDLYEHTNYGYIPWRQQQLNRIKKAITVSETGKKYLENQYPFMKGKVIVSRLGTEDHGINPYLKTDTIKIVSCSNLVAVKRVDLIVRSLELLKIPVNWIHFGDGPKRKKIEKLIKGLPVNIHAELPGVIKHDELMNYYTTNSVDVFLNVSSSEGIPVSIMEAMSFGVPVIATDVGGTSEIVNEKTGLLLDADFSPDKLAAGIEVLIKRPDYNQIRKYAREKWENEIMAKKVYPEFINLLQNL
jgi:colanic acid/amylovoran biosynthesis glycosyltransferase